METSSDVGLNRIFQMTVNEAREACAHSWMKEALEKFVCQFTCRPRMEEEPLPYCRFAMCRSEDLRAQTADEDVDCYLIS